MFPRHLDLTGKHITLHSAQCSWCCLGHCLIRCRSTASQVWLTSHTSSHRPLRGGRCVNEEHKNTHSGFTRYLGTPATMALCPDTPTPHPHHMCRRNETHHASTAPHPSATSAPASVRHTSAQPHLRHVVTAHKCHLDQASWLLNIVISNNDADTVDKHQMLLGLNIIFICCCLILKDVK